ncbi:bacteriocin immunity protein [Pseudomonas sp. P39-UII1]|uniref:bacteriocin immunity protein n=1 Tax=Pseudomonas sp. P39-UII1 TaxID=3080333 RepID=UPI0032082071
MDLRSSLDHEEQSFLRLVDDIWQVETDKVSHDTLITHFSNIVGHPAGSDLLFYPEIDEFGGIKFPRRYSCNHQSLASAKRPCSF